MLNAKAISKSFFSANGEVSILKNLSFAVGPKTTTAIIGPSGAGKSSLLAILAGLDLPDSGSVELCGQLTSNLNEKQKLQLRRRDVGFIFQTFHLIPTFSALENVELVLVANKIANGEKIASKLLDQVGLSQRLKNLPSQLSGGECQRVAIARAMAHNPKIIFADEPSGSLDHKTGDQVMDLLMQQIENTDAALVLVTHNETYAKKCQKTFELREGSLFQS